MGEFRIRPLDTGGTAEKRERLDLQPTGETFAADRPQTYKPASRMAGESTAQILYNRAKRATEEDAAERVGERMDAV